MASPVDICNLALSHFGDEAQVTSISPPDGSIQAEQAAKFYPIARDQLLEAHAWNFNTRRATLAELDENSVDSWTFAYSLPAGTLRVLSVLPPAATDDTATEDFVIEALEDGALVLYTNVEEATVRFLVRVTNTGLFSPGFVVALARLLASYLAGPIIKGKSGATVAAAQLKHFIEVDFPNATAHDSNGRQLRAPYKDYKPSWMSDR